MIWQGRHWPGNIYRMDPSDGVEVHYIIDVTRFETEASDEESCLIFVVILNSRVRERV